MDNEICLMLLALGISYDYERVQLLESQGHDASEIRAHIKRALRVIPAELISPTIQKNISEFIDT